MHFILLGAVLHATVLGVLAFFILFAAGKAEGFTALLGRLLGYWVLLLAILGLVFGIFAAATGKHMGPGWMMRQHGWRHMGRPPFDCPVEPEKPGAAPAKPATPAEPNKPG
jgi:hypothetical protein